MGVGGSGLSETHWLSKLGERWKNLALGCHLHDMAVPPLLPKRKWTKRGFSEYAGRLERESDGCGLKVVVFW
jgi:hypothetical protein